MFQVIGRPLGADGSTMYQTAAGDFFLYPKDNGGWVIIWEPVIQSQRLNDMVAQASSRSAAMEWIESAFSFS